MSADLFISYAWTSTAHREWVRLLASQLHLIGYDIKLDEEVDYGSSLTGFMRQVTEASHVLLIVDENYVDRANNKPESGVGKETKWMNEAFPSKPDTWLSVVFINNPESILPDWLKGHDPRGFDFNFYPEKNEFPGSLQLEEIWRWVEGLPANKAHAVPISLVRKRAARLEHIGALRDKALYANPSLKGRVTFRYRDHAHYTIGHGEYEFKVVFSGASTNSVHVYTDGGLEAIGLIADPNFDLAAVGSFLTPGRAVSPVVEQRVVLLNSHGVLCIIAIDEVQNEVNAKEYIPEHVTFSYEVLVND
ncbi:toll/interleukin-1 receptor domain-containing protein [Pseudomonas sp. MWU318]|uniref:toll/interleukin-1 receptor domain-containing protein n=1 Tax=Pseudomonas sp. MWU318 TaxID=2802569 RepID=UPI0019289EBB|nr:toll/interleukin-1 receptor domain-containing protein [Pseudomonas sp. MWU318]